MMMNTRTIEVFRDDEWKEVKEMYELRKGDSFRMFEPDGQPVITDKGETVFHAISEPYWSDIHNQWTIDIGGILQ